MTELTFKYEYALVCSDIPNSLDNGLSLDNHDPINLDLARKQHQTYLNVLESSSLKLIKIDSDEKYPDCVFVEDTAVALNNRIFITNPGAETRREEVNQIKNKLESISEELKLEIGQVINKNEAFIDGGDVLFTGKEFIVGISSRTNQKGANELREFFKNVPLITCQVNEGLHLKSSMSMVSPNVIIISTSNVSKSIREQIKQNSSFYNEYKFIEVPHDGAANILSVNNKIVTPSDYESYYEKNFAFNNYSDRCVVDNSEFKKIDGCLTCRSVFFSSKN